MKNFYQTPTSSALHQEAVGALVGGVAGRKEILESGVHPTRSRQYVTAAHTEEDVEQTLTTIDEVFGKLQ